MCFLQGLIYHTVKWQHLILTFDHKGEIAKLSLGQFWAGAKMILCTISFMSRSFFTSLYSWILLTREKDLGP